MSETRIYDGEKYLVPSVIAFIVFGIVPVVLVIRTSFMYWEAFAATGPRFIGLDNFEQLMNSAQYMSATGRTLLFVGVSLVIQMGLGLAIALLLDREFRGDSVVRTLLVLPLTIPPISVGANWLLLLRTDTGLVPKMLSNFGITFQIGENTLDAWVAIFLMDAWHWTPLIALIFLAGLTSVPPSLIESARIDGANRWEIFWHVQLPQLKTVGVVALLIRMMDLFRSFDDVWMLTSGGPGEDTMLLNLEIVRIMTQQTRYGIGAALSLFALYLIIILSWGLVNMLHREVLE
ncbi:ABC transporter substrate-binding protein [Halobacteriales archaeon QS_1_68_17]|nr:MAG: ABC transporter substrate-binding protein [Halobacteriales archaeon QS_1_68_17]